MVDVEIKESEIVLKFEEELPPSSDDLSLHIEISEPSPPEEENLASLIDEVSKLEREFEAAKETEIKITLNENQAEGDGEPPTSNEEKHSRVSSKISRPIPGDDLRKKLGMDEDRLARRLSSRHQ